MGVPRFFRYLSERFPLINENITVELIPEFDNLYLDMNGIVHNCSHNNTGGLFLKEEDDVFVEAFKYIVRLFHIIKPKRLIYMAVDGCAPRAKLNQQRSRRFRANIEMQEARDKALEMGDEIAGTPFDSNCITPGTEFMAKLTEHLRFFVQKKINEDPVWQGVAVVVSGPDVPGEGEHKIMDYIRTAKAQPGYEPNLRHCLYGLDADLIMLSLASHEPHFALLREEVVFGRQTTESVEDRVMMNRDKFQLLHISLLREYLELEFLPPKDVHFSYSLERVIDDFILFCMLVGNDFLPPLPFAEIGEGGLDDFFTVYKQHLQHASGKSPWLTSSCGEIAFDQLKSFLHRYATVEDERLEMAVAERGFVLGRRRIVGPRSATPPEHDRPVDEPAPTPADARVQYYDVKFGIDMQSPDGAQKQRGLFQAYLEGLQWVMYYYFRGADAASWGWYYRYYHAPMVWDLVSYDQFSRPVINFEIGQPFKPFQQLMAVLPAGSKSLLPPCYQWLFDSPESPILSFYPRSFEIDVDGVKVPWGGVSLISFIDPELLFSAMKEAERRGPPLTEVEKKRNEFDKARTYRFDKNQSRNVSSTMPNRLKSVPHCQVIALSFSHPVLPRGMPYFLNDLLPGVDLQLQGFPWLKRYPLTTSFGSGVKIFQYEARGKSIIISLHPTGAAVPSEEEIAQILRAQCAEVDFPFAHRGKVVAVHTTHTRHLPNGKTLPNNPREHESLVRDVIRDLRRKGLVVDSDVGMPAGDAAAGRGRQGKQSTTEEMCQPMAEIRIAESSYLDGEGKTQYRFKSGTEFRLLQLVRLVDPPPPVGPRTLQERFPIGASVICISKDSDCFGQTGVIERNAGDPGCLEATFVRGATSEEQASLQQEIQQIITNQNASMHWHEIADVASKTHLDVNVVRQIFGSVKFRSTEYVRDDVGMNLTCELRSDGSALCLPAYSFRYRDTWWFSDLAVTALKDYRCKFPGVFEAIRRRHDDWKDIEARNSFPECGDLDYASKQLVKYCNSCPFKKLRLAPSHYMALSPSGIEEIQKVVDRHNQELASRPVQHEHVRGYKRLYKAEDAGSRPPSELLSDEIAIGHRGIYIKANGLVPCGSKSTVIGVYGSGQSAELELLLDEDNFGGTDLCGRTTQMRGLQVPISSFMPLQRRTPGSPVAPDLGAVPEPRPAAEFGEKVPAEQATSNGALSKSEASTLLLQLLRSPPQGPAPEPEAPETTRAEVPVPAKPVSSSTDRIKGRLAAQLAGCAVPVQATEPLAPNVEILPLPAFFSARSLDTTSVASDRVRPEPTRSTDEKGRAGSTKLAATRAGETSDSAAVRTAEAEGGPDWSALFDQLLDLTS